MSTEIIQENLFLDSKNADILEHNGSRATFFLNGDLNLGREKFFLSLLSTNIVFNEPNIIDGVNNVFYYKKPNDNALHNYSFETGLYSIDEINNEIMQLLIDQTGSENAYQFVFKANTSNNKCTVQFRTKTGWALDCTPNDCILRILGFTASQGVLISTTDNQIIDSQSTIMLNSLRNYIVTCNLVSDSYLNGNRSNAIAQFTPDTEPFSQFTYQPLHLSHLAINRNTKIDKVIISFLNQNEKNCDFTGGNEGATPESWTVRLRLSNNLSN